jgi:hypothetical protein
MDAEYMTTIEKIFDHIFGYDQVNASSACQRHEKVRPHG